MTTSETRAARRSPTMRRLLQQEAAIFLQSPSIPPGCDVGYVYRMYNGNKEFHWTSIRMIRRNTIADDSLTIVFEIPALHTLRRNPAVSREIVRKWRPPVEADDHIVGDLRAALVSLAVVVQAWFLYQNNHCLTLD